MGKKLNNLILNVMFSSFILTSVFAEEIKLPRKPGPENDKTLIGIDSNKNGVRDDVEIFIFENITKEPGKYLAYLKYVESKIAMLKYVNDLEKLSELDQQKSRDIMCIGSFEGNEFIENQRKLREKIYNTSSRKKAVEVISDKYNSFAKPKMRNFKSKRDACRF